MSEGASSSTTNGYHEEEESTEMNAYKKEACKVVTFKIVYDKRDLESDKAMMFKPEMAHQIFGESESIFGYRHVSISINFLHNSCRCYLDMETSGKIKNDTMKPDDILKSLDSWLPTNYTQSYDEFLKWVDNEEHDKMYGEVIGSFNGLKPIDIFADHQITPTYKITKNDISDTEFTDFHARFETYIVWFIDAANFIDLDDDRWIIFYVYEEFEHPLEKKTYRSPVAFCTVYKFFSYPDKVRARISQFFVLPSHQRRGIGTTLYETVSRSLRALDDVVDITVEEPTSSFQKIRDLEDCGLVHKEMLALKYNYFGTSSKKIFELGKKAKIGRRQLQRVYDILGLYYALQKGNIAYKKVLDNIKSRITDENERESKPGKRFCNLDGASVSIQMDKNAQIEAEFKRHCDDIEPSVKYLEEKLQSWLKRNGCGA